MTETAEIRAADELVRLAAMVPAGLLAALEAEARRLGVSVASLVRWSLADSLGYVLGPGMVGTRAATAPKEERLASRRAGDRAEWEFKRAALEAARAQRGQGGREPESEPKSEPGSA